MAWTRSQTIGVRAEARDPGGRPVGGDLADWATAAVLHERYLEDVFRYVLRRVPGVPEAEDITAEVFAAAAAGLPRFHGQSPPYLWLLGIARRKIADSLRRRTVRREVLHSELPDDTPGSDPLWETLVTVEGPEAALVRAEARRVVRELVAGLSPDQREAVLLQYMERLSVAEIAVVMGRSLSSVTSLLKRARATLYRRGQGYFAED
jgi:RNA polymerase sigma-70 factor, ECF subfamily